MYIHILVTYCDNIVRVNIARWLHTQNEMLRHARVCCASANRKACRPAGLRLGPRQRQRHGRGLRPDGEGPLHTRWSVVPGRLKMGGMNTKKRSGEESINVSRGRRL
jgi:hypothetical protein